MPESDNTAEDRPDIKIVVLVLENGKAPAEEWLLSLRDKTTRARVARQIDKLSRGLGVQKGLADIAELKLDFGPGYRVYYASLDAGTILVLLGGGDKSTQAKDIGTARALWQDFQDHGRPEAALRAWREQQGHAAPAAPEESGMKSGKKAKKGRKNETEELR